MRNKKGGTKIWWGPSRTLSASTKISVEQKMVEQKIVERKFGGTLRHSKCKYRKVSRKKNGGTKMLVGTLTDPKCKY